MATVVPSFIAKVARAKKHLIELDDAINKFAATDPYTVCERIEGQKKRKLLVFTADPANTDIPVIAADVIYNLRSSLDHLMSALVARKDRGSPMFPIFFKGVWEAIVPGENQERIKQRIRWASDVKTLSDEVITIFKRLQPPDADPWQKPKLPVLPLLNTLSNRDRHEKLPVITAGMSSVRIEFIDSNGNLNTGTGSLAPNYVLENETEIKGIPPDAMDVKITGTPLVGILLGPDNAKRHALLPDSLCDIANVIDDEIFPLLSPYIRAD